MSGDKPFSNKHRNSIIDLLSWTL